MPDETAVPPHNLDDVREDRTADTRAGSPTVAVDRKSVSPFGPTRPAITLVIAALALLLAVSIAWMSRPDAGGTETRTPLVALTKRDWLLLPANEREGAVDRALRAQCNGTNIDTQAALVTRLIDATYGYGSNDTPVKQVIEYLDTAPLVCWGSIGGTK